MARETKGQGMIIFNYIPFCFSYKSSLKIRYLVNQSHVMSIVGFLSSVITLYLKNICIKNIDPFDTI